jgi:DNA-binding IclR family transcriptional regulator
MPFSRADHELGSLHHALDALEALAAQRHEVTLADLSRSVSVSKSGLYRILATLVARGYAARTRTRAYRLGVRLWELGCRVPDLGLVEVAAPFMQRLTRDTDETCQLGILVGFDVVYLHRVEAGQPVRVHTEIGSRIEAHCTSTGMALLAQLPGEELARVLPARLRRVAPETIVSRRKLVAELARVRARGYAAGRGYWREDVAGVAAPLFGRDGAAVAALNIAAPSLRFTKQRMAEVADAVCRTAGQISAALGFSPNGRRPGGLRSMSAMEVK